MSLPEIIPSNLPIFVQNKDRTAFANSVIPSGSVLLFAESDGNGGSKLIAKNPDGSFSEVGGGGGGGESFYKCASVDTTNEEWSGYKLIMLDGEYTYEQGVTTGLTYSYVTPEVGTVYNSNALIVVKTVIVPPSGPASPVNLNGYTDSEGWTVSASSEYSNGQHAAWKAFKNTQTGITWLSNENVNYPHWLKWKNLQPTVLLKYRFKANTSAGYNKELTAWELQASNDDFSTYVVLDERSGIRWSSGELKSFEVTQNIGRYTAYRLYCVSGNSTNYVAISEFETNWE